MKEVIAVDLYNQVLTGGGYSVLPTQQRLQGRTMYSGKKEWKMRR